MRSRFHRSGQLQLAYETWGQGDHLLVCLHGYGKDRTDFRFLAESLTDSYTSVLIDLPFHGESNMEDWNGETPLDMSQWSDWLSDLIHSFGKPVHSILGFSIGGRLSLCYAQSPAEGFTGLILLASDGIVMNTWNRLFTQTSMGRKTFGHFMRPSSRPEALAVLFEQLNVISLKRKKLIVDNVSGAHAKKKLLSTWLTLRKLWPDLKQVDRNSKKASITLYLGRYDQVIKPYVIRKELHRKGLDWRINELNCGHDMMSKVVLTIIKEELSDRAGIE